MERVPDPLVVYRDGVILWTNQASRRRAQVREPGRSPRQPLLDLVHPADRGRCGRRARRPARRRQAPARSASGRRTARSARSSSSEPQAVIFEEVPARMVARARRHRARRAPGAARPRRPDVAARLPRRGGRARDQQPAGLRARRARPRDGETSTPGGLGDRRRLAGDRARGGRAGRAGSRATCGCSRAAASSSAEASIYRARAPRPRRTWPRRTSDTRGRLVVDVRPLPRVLGDRGAARAGVHEPPRERASTPSTRGDPATNRIEVRAFTDAEGRAVVEVEDNGRGIPPEVQSRIFEPFFTTKGPRSGSGLGLAICHRIVSDLGGRIEVASSSGRGGALSRAPRRPRRSPAESRAPRPRSARRLRVLVIDDEAQLARRVGRMLEEEHDVEVVTSGEEALGRLEAGADYDAILCDLMMARR